MQLGQFSLSLSVSDIAISKSFYEKLGFEPLPSCGSIEDKWLIMKSGSVMIGLFEGMFEDNIMTFNPDNVREIERLLTEEGVEMLTPVKGESGPGHCIFKDPDGNTIMLDQF
ncbi:VOC family protein [Alteromonas sediminis]|uniref:VOC family protein n=1 Tax=Alteromonas sediminis TaxID=2259342 RepID=A0A3N5Y9H2_9ALTE|nr:VOC family protein [Alteromonas sediminis]RPJ67909.1 VOC family protein [Alteromonas sediminis]